MSTTVGVCAEGLYGRGGLPGRQSMGTVRASNVVIGRCARFRSGANRTITGDLRDAAVARSTGSGPQSIQMFERLLYGPDGRIRHRRLFIVLPVCFVAAMFGPAALFLVPKISDNEIWKWTGVVLTTFALKVPLIMLLFMFIRRNLELPTRPPVWGEDEVGAILQALRDQAAAALDQPDTAARLAYLSREAWNVADRVGGAAKTDALTVALQIDEQLIAIKDREARA